MQLLNDIRNYEKLKNNYKIYLISFLTAFSGILSSLDSMIPKPIPMAKIGIANIITLVLILEDRFFLAVWVAISRCVVGALMTGTILSYTFLLSTGGAVGATVGMGLVFRYAGKHFSEIGISVIGAFFNTLIQGLIVTMFFGIDRGIVFLISLFILFSVVNGILTGFIVKRFYHFL